MAHEAQIINNPDSTPGAVSTGYQLQNTNIVAARVGCDNTVVEGGTGECKLLISGPVDVNGVLYSISADVTFALSTAGRYYIHLATGGTGTLTPTIGTGANTFDADKNARYTDTGTFRVLNWVIGYDGTTARASRLHNPEIGYNDIDDSSPRETWITGNGVWIAPQTKYYTISVTGCGGDGSYDSQYGNGGANGSTGIKRILINSGTTWTAAFTTGANATTFTDGTTTLSAGNQGGAATGFDVTFIGLEGGRSYLGYCQGAPSIYGVGGYGSGGYGHALNGASSGKAGVIRITG